MSRLVLHRAFGSPPARAALMLCDMIGLQPEIKEVNVLKMEHKTPEFLKLNPMGTVPVVEDGDFVLADSNAIMKYLLEKYGGDKREILYPSKLRTRALIEQTMYFNVGVFFAALIQTARETVFSSPGLGGPTLAHINLIERSYSVLEAYLQKNRYVAADHLTLADLSNGSTATAIQAMHKVDADKYPRYADWLSRIQQEPVFKTINEPGAAFFAKMITKAWEKNKQINK